MALFTDFTGSKVGIQRRTQRFGFQMAFQLYVLELTPQLLIARLPLSPSMMLDYNSCGRTNKGTENGMMGMRCRFISAGSAAIEISKSINLPVPTGFMQLYSMYLGPAYTICLHEPFGYLFICQSLTSSSFTHRKRQAH